MPGELIADARPVLAETVGLTRRFGGLLAVDGLDLTVHRGGVHALIGPNGAGKSTTLALIGGQLAPTAGRIRIDGVDTTGRPPYRVARRGVGRSFQITNVLLGVTCDENVRVAVQARRRFHHPFGRVHDATERRRTRDVLDIVGLASRADDLAGELSHGEQRHLEIGIAMAAAPRLLLLDEPTAGMSLTERERITDLIRRLGEQTTILLVEHDVALVRAVADVVSVLHEGRLLAQGTATDVLRDRRVHDVYLRGIGAGAG